jgi:hypothetical protein
VIKGQYSTDPKQQQQQKAWFFSFPGMGVDVAMYGFMRDARLGHIKCAIQEPELPSD